MYVNNIRSPNNIFIRWLLLFGLIFSTVLFISVSVKADVIMKGNKNFPSYAFHESYNDKQNIHKLNALLEKAKNEGYNILICSGDSYNSSYYKNLKPYWILISSEALNYDGVNFYTNDSSTCKYFHCTLVVSDTDEYSNVNNLSDSNFQFKTNFSSKINKQYYPTVLYYNFPSGLNVVNNADTSFFPEFLIEYDKNDLKSYPIDTINITSPTLGSNIKTNNGYFDVVIKGKIGIDFSKSLLGNTLFPMTPEWIGNYIRRDFRYSVDGDVEDENNLSYLGVGNKNFSNYIIEYLNQFYQDINPFVDKDKIGDINTIWTIGVTGNMNDWSKKHYYNFIINTRLWCGYLNNDLNYKFSFVVPVAFSGNLTDVNPSEYKTIVIDNYSLKRGFYSDDDFDGIDDESNEIIPPDEIEIIHPSTSTPSLPSDDGLDDGLQVVNILKDIYKDFCHGVNGSVNILKSFFSVVNSTVKSVCDYSQQMVISFSNIFGFMPSPIPQLITMSLAIMIFVSVLGFIKK